MTSLEHLKFIDDYMRAKDKQAYLASLPLDISKQIQKDVESHMSFINAFVNTEISEEHNTYCKCETCKADYKDQS